MENGAAPLYLDWSFWAVIVATVAVFLSQLPPMHGWLKRAKLEIELYSKISISHKVGNPNLQIHLIINNVGGRKIRIRDISTSIERDGKLVATLPAQNYLQNKSDKETLLFTTFSLGPAEEWAHIINLLIFFNREEEATYRTLEAEMLANLRDKKDALTEELKSVIEIDNELVEPFHEFFRKHFIWESGEYKLKVNISTDQKKADVSKSYRFTIFESHSDRLKEIKKHYKFGGGIWWDPNMPTNVIVDIKEA